MNLINNHVRLSLVVAAAAALLLSSCTNIFNFGPSISELTTTTGFVSAYQPADRTNVFYIDSPQVCFSAKLTGAREDTEIDANWVFVKGEMSKEVNPIIGSDKIHCTSNCYFGFTLPAPSEGFISGEYKINLAIDGQHKADYTFYIQKDQAGPIPQIKGFSAQPLNITAGEPTVMSWQVLNASRINILPNPGQVKSEGKLTFSPAADTTYTIWAVNRSGISSNSICVKVKETAKTSADLVVTDFWYVGTTFYYTVKNAGKLASTGSESYLYKNDVYVSEDYVAPLNPGEERTESFAVYHFSPRFSSILNGVTSDATTDAVNMRMCLNANSAFPEFDNTNNCMEHNIGPLLDVNLTRYAATAQWQSSSGALSWPMLRDAHDGWAQVGSAQINNGESYPDSVIMTLPVAANSWIQACVGIPQGTPVVQQPFTVPHKAKIITMVGLTNDAPESASVKFIIGTAQGSDITYYPPVVINTKDKLEKYEVDLSKLAGKQVQFILKVESSGPLQQGSAVWTDPSLIQEQ